MKSNSTDLAISRIVLLVWHAFCSHLARGLLPKTETPMKSNSDIKTKLLQVEEAISYCGQSVRPPPFAPNLDRYGNPTAPLEPSSIAPQVSANMKVGGACHAHYSGKFASPEDICENCQEYFLRKSQADSKQAVCNQTRYVQGDPTDFRHPDIGAPCYIVRPPPRESLCCPILILLLGLSCPMLWLGGCCFLSARTPRARFLGHMSVLAFLLAAASSLVVIFHFNARTGQWPWSACLWNGQSC